MPGYDVPIIAGSALNALGFGENQHLKRRQQMG
jgi:hypothetical protein